jgi:hypothetical protein
MEVWRDTPTATGLERIVMHQAGYIRHIVAEFEKVHNGGVPLRHYWTPMEAHEKKGSEEQAGADEEIDPDAVPTWVPDLRDSKEEHGGKFGWVVRGTRPDVAVAQRKISTRYHCWNRADDQMVYRTYAYLKATAFLGMGFWATPKDLPGLLIGLRTDSDHANDTTTTKSMSGGRTVLRGAHGTWIPVEWRARRQGCTSRNTGEAETTALDEGTFQEAIPLQGILEELLLRDVRILSEIDNTAAIGAGSRGFSRKLAYLKKARRVSLGALHECFFGENPERIGDDAYSVNRLNHRSGERNESDMMTKAFAVDRHWELCHMIGLRTIPEEAARRKK